MVMPMYLYTGTVILKYLEPNTKVLKGQNPPLPLHDHTAPPNAGESELQTWFSLDQCLYNFSRFILRFRTVQLGVWAKSKVNPPYLGKCTVQTTKNCHPQTPLQTCSKALPKLYHAPFPLP
ncbi:hypothetical protein BLNAU_7996 [Blattamonas nauphoetae]|uniref:Uncharacterized protein n=1 Tax=Blattamonas nauphoetae TaxID=2049346 RepID=A0ABQ9Y0B9_9EUKA|nr:hypothetical protein BLNAU_7996 [Blattamonas nauphoetae]